MIRKLKALGVILGLIAPVADLIRALGALGPQASRIIAEIQAAFYRDLLEESRHEPEIGAVRTALLEVVRKIREASASGALKAIAILALALALAPQARAQAAAQPTPLPADFVAAGATWKNPGINAWGLYAHKITGETYSFSLFDTTSGSIRPFTLTVQPTTGIAQHVLDFGQARIFAVGTAGFSKTAENVGNAFSLRGAAAIPVRRGWSVLVMAGVIRSNLAGTACTVSVGPGWGK